MTIAVDETPDALAGRLAPYLDQHLPQIGRLERLEKFASGQSNPTYLAQTGQGRFVLRIKPPGPLLPSAHMVEREYRVMQALGQSAVPVPRMLHLAEDAASPLGRAFFVMEHLDGRIFWNPALPELAKPERAPIFAEMGRVLAALHDITPADIGLGDYGRPGDYFARQCKRWTAQYRASERSPKPDMEALITWLGANLPPDDGQVALVHGDYRLDNMIFSHTGPAMLGLLDWELSTLGHPMADLAYQAMQWRMPHDGPLKGLGGQNRTALGLPDEQAYVAAYCSARKISPPRHWRFYMAFAFFRLAAILEGVGARADAGNASNPSGALAYGEQVPELVAGALGLIRGGK
ncbi:phosphotransferase [Alphaproteobacteria bacterium KMM 3653]|uniref:Phosphotransferase n=1 Tax=Harenicola maris TaxID=2841044 RepID=A0AAP2CR88_9RHOB|nr:phosphotransferase [Harenicola maris]